jgi:hypothetical protein
MLRRGFVHYCRARDIWAAYDSKTLSSLLILKTYPSISDSMQPAPIAEAGKSSQLAQYLLLVHLPVHLQSGT